LPIAAIASTENSFSARTPRGEGTGFFRNTRRIPDAAMRGRTPDGSYNDVRDPMAGAAGTRFGFNTPPERTPGETGERLLTPNPRTVSRVLMTRTDGFKPVPFLNLTAAAWIQFMNHDWVSYGDPAEAEPYRIPLDDDDPVRRPCTRRTCSYGRRSRILQRRARRAPPPHQRSDQLVGWIADLWQRRQDGAFAAEPRRGQAEDRPQDGESPRAAGRRRATGFRRNWWVGLSMLHTLFVKEHNAICGMLAAQLSEL